MKNVIRALVITWLSKASVEVGEKETKVLGDLLDTDCDHRSTHINAQMNGLEISPSKPVGQNLFWRRIFNDKDIYSLIFDLCSSETVGRGEGQLDERQKSLAQARLLRLLPRIAILDFKAISTTNFPEIDSRYGSEGKAQGLLGFAALDMVDKEEDILMHLTLIDFFAHLLESLSTISLDATTMDYLKRLLRTATLDDTSLYKSLESLAMSPNSSPELVELFTKLNDQ